MQGLLLLSLGLSLFALPSTKANLPCVGTISYVQPEKVFSASSNSNQEGSSSDGFDLSTIFAGSTGVVALGGAGAVTTVFWKQRRKKFENQPAKTIDKEDNKES